jgi:hypothetical protein
MQERPQTNDSDVVVLGETDPAPVFNVKEEEPTGKVASNLKGDDELSQWKALDEEACVLRKIDGLVCQSVHVLDAPASSMRPGTKGNKQQHEQFLYTAPSAGIIVKAEHDGEEVKSSTLKITVAEAEEHFSQRHLEVMSELLEKCPCDPVPTLLSKYEVACRIKGISSKREAVSLARMFLHDIGIT